MSARETDLYPPVKAYLEGQGYAVKGEVQGCDVVALRGAEPPVIVELKQRFSLDLVLQAARAFEQEAGSGDGAGGTEELNSHRVWCSYQDWPPSTFRPGDHGRPLAPGWVEWRIIGEPPGDIGAVDTSGFLTMASFIAPSGP